LGGRSTGPRFVALDVNETNSPLVAMDGLELAPFAGATTPMGAVPSVEMRNVVGVQVFEVTPLHVLRTKTWGVTPSNATFDTKFVASDAKATHCPSELITGLKLGPFPALTPSADVDTSCAAFPLPLQVGAAPLHVGRQKTWVIKPDRGTLEVRFVAVEVNAENVPELLIDGSKLAPLAELPFGSVLTMVVVGVQPADARHVLRRNISLLVFALVVTRLLEIDA
jgi:hypothetical protein